METALLNICSKRDGPGFLLSFFSAGTDASAFWVQLHFLTVASHNSILDRVGRTEAQRRAQVECRNSLVSHCSTEEFALVRAVCSSETRA